MKALFRGFCRNENGKKTIYLNEEAVKGDWIYGGYAKCNNREYILPDIDLVGYEWVFKNIEVIPETVCEAVRGLTDKNVQQVFEGDIVKAFYEEDREYLGVKYNSKTETVEEIVFNKDNYQFMLKQRIEDIDFYRPLTEKGDTPLPIVLKGIEVIGTKWGKTTH